MPRYGVALVLHEHSGGYCGAVCGRNGDAEWSFDQTAFIAAAFSTAAESVAIVQNVRGGGAAVVSDNSFLGEVRVINRQAISRSRARARWIGQRASYERDEVSHV